jgi:hypothetical protein
LKEGHGVGDAHPELLVDVLLVRVVVGMTAINETARRVLLDCDTPLEEQLEGKAPTTWQKWNHRSKQVQKGGGPSCIITSRGDGGTVGILCPPAATYY